MKNETDIKAYPKFKVYENEAYLNFIRSKPCLVCGQKSEAHHVRRSYWGAGTSQKPHDYVTIPLCPEDHNLLVEKTIDCDKAIIDLLMEYIEKRRWTKK